MKTELGSVSNEIKNYFLQNKFSEEISDLLLSLMNQQAFDLVTKMIEMKLDETDVRAIDSAAIDEDFDEYDKADLYREYFEEKTGLRAYDLVVDYLKEIFEVIKKQTNFFTNMGKFLGEVSKDAGIEQVKNYLDQMIEKSERDLSVNLSKSFSISQ